MTDLARALQATGSARRARFDAEAGVLLAGACNECGAQAWPAGAVCLRCGSGDIELEPLPQAGSLTTWSRVWVPVEGIQPPYLLGIVQLGAVEVVGHVDGLDAAGTVPVPVPVRLAVHPDRHPPFSFVVAPEPPETLAAAGDAMCNETRVPLDGPHP